MSSKRTFSIGSPIVLGKRREAVWAQRGLTLLTLLLATGLTAPVPFVWGREGGPVIFSRETDREAVEGRDVVL